MSRAPRVTALADSVLQRASLLTNPYFASFVDGSMSLPCFRATQEQFYFGVVYYARPIAALVSRISEPAQRLALVHNIVEEHGGFQECQFHQNTFRKFLASIQGRSPDLASIPICPAVHAFNNTLIGVCTSDDIEVGVCCLGIIEHVFAEISALIGRTVVDRGWIRSPDLAHYALHADLDIRHAEDFFAIAEPSWETPPAREKIRLGLELGAYAFDQLYRGLLVHAESADE